MPSSLISNISTASCMVQQKNSMNNKKNKNTKYGKPLSLVFHEVPTESEGGEYHKFITILPKKKKSSSHIIGAMLNPRGSF